MATPGRFRTAAALARNAASVESGLASFTTAFITRFTADGELFDKILAVDVNVFWTGAATAEPAAVAGLPAPGGCLVLCFDPPSGQRREMFAEHLSAGGFDNTRIPYGDTLLVVRATPRP
ncbi:hypothetical protein [Phytomonospora endophytica]|uniref:O-methyltransferase domain-containing protein n=1 Tax=Phytomonospora endophytica TaxID=714109 RepID=A0A841FVE6_9ACTN|nr:hypothetical protein [Phytomonospora endophytica]MBB6036469.1 hypothetical protein [Phytomonospora endophytica]GIG65791.1 hypothetical protein Pen01_20860 [Phytomonospora endophytica]